MSEFDEMEAEWITIFQSEVAEYTRDRWRLQFDDNIKPYKQNRDWEQYIRHTFAWFKCRKCKRGWPSNVVMALFHFHLNKKHRGTVKVRLFRQDCKKCRNAPMEEPLIDTKNLKILTENLVKNIRRKCYDEAFEYHQTDPAGRDVKSPHEPYHCEACINGICKLKDAVTQKRRTQRS